MTYIKQHFKRFSILLLCLFPINLHAGYTEDKHQQAFDELQTIEKAVGHYKTALFSEKNHKNLKTLSSQDKKLKKDYLAVKEKFNFWDTVYGLKLALIQLSSSNDERMKDEADVLAQNIIKEIARLKKEYKIVGTPSLQNLLILAKIKKRGACKHWAEDLLNTITNIHREFFTAYWAEAHPGKMTEHNVAVLVAKNEDFKDGLIIDPWRRAGNPFWILVKEDPHPFKPWPGFKPR